MKGLEIFIGSEDNCVLVVKKGEGNRVDEEAMK